MVGALWGLGAIGGLGGTVLQFVFSVLIAGLLLANAEAAVRGITAVASRFFGEDASDMVILAEKSLERLEAMERRTDRMLELGERIDGRADQVLVAAAHLPERVPEGQRISEAELVESMAQLAAIRKLRDKSKR